MSPNCSSTSLNHKGPPPGIVATAFVPIFLARLYPVTRFGAAPTSPRPDEPLGPVVAFFEARPSAVRGHSAPHLRRGGCEPLTLFRLPRLWRRDRVVRRFPDRVHHDGFVVALWATTDQGILRAAAVLPALFRIQFALGGPGFSVPFGPLLAGVSATSGFRGMLPKWAIISGLAVAVIGALSWLEMVFPNLLFLAPLMRFPGFGWLIPTGLLAPSLRRIATD